ncbi:MAG: FAD-dependent oxidoreductase [Candidatus Omnitrophica bacterium]|nr:FAD-dependent oxidoreductase [Candidatus Omnitrophota bacterium]
MSNEMYDVIIIGGGAAGLTAGIYSSRERLKTLLLEKGVCGGLTASTDIVENYPGFPDSVKGADLMEKFKEHAEKFGVVINEFEEVKNLKAEGKNIKVKTDKGEYNTHAVIVASGSIPKKLNIPGEEELKGRGVSYCATCDGPLFRNKDVAIIGCGNSGLQEGESVLRYVKSVTFVEFLPHMTAAKILQERLQKKENTTFFLNHALTAINGEKKVGSIKVKNRQTGEDKDIPVDGVFIYAGFLPNAGFLEGTVKLDGAGYIMTNEKMETTVPGIYAAGDVCSKKVRQIDTACGDGTVAVISALERIKELSAHQN